MTAVRFLRRLKPRLYELRAHVGKLTAEIDFGDITFFGGIAMVGFGVGGRYGLITAGVLLVFAARPLVYWVKGNNGK